MADSKGPLNSALSAIISAFCFSSDVKWMDTLDGMSGRVTVSLPFPALALTILYTVNISETVLHQHFASPSASWQYGFVYSLSGLTHREIIDQPAATDLFSCALMPH